jgi:hypothetical protein
MVILGAAAASVWLMSCAVMPNPSQEAERALLAAARDLVAVTEGGRQSEIATRVSEGGFGCMDGIVTRTVFASELATPGSWIHAFFLDGEEFRRKVGSDQGITSLSEVIAMRKPLNFRATLRPRTGSPVNSYGCVFVGPGGGREAKVCFSRRGTTERWDLNMSEGPWCG